MMLASLFASIIGPISPRALFTDDRRRLSPALALLGLALATAASASLLVPFMRAAVDASVLPLDDGLATPVILFNTFVLNPVGACLGALVTAVLLGTVPLVTGHESTWGRCLLVATVVGGVETGRRLFVAGVLWLREIAGRADPQYDVRTGLDALLVALPDLPTPVLAVSRHVGLFEAWAILVAAAGLALAERLPRRVAVCTAIVTSVAFNGVLVALEVLA